jgi:Transposase IS4
VLKELVLPWARTGRLVVADSYFASVATAEELYRLVLRFTGVVKIATRRFPMKELASTELSNRGDRRGLLSLDADGKPKILAFVWMDRDRRCFVSTASSLAPGVSYNRFRWRQISEDPDAAPESI